MLPVHGRRRLVRRRLQGRALRGPRLLLVLLRVLHHGRLVLHVRRQLVLRVLRVHHRRRPLLLVLHHGLVLLRHCLLVHGRRLHPLRRLQGHRALLWVLHGVGRLRLHLLLLQQLGHIRYPQTQRTAGRGKQHLARRKLQHAWRPGGSSSAAAAAG